MTASRRLARVAVTLVAFVAVVAADTPANVPVPDLPDWIVVDYGEIVDRRQPTHSGEPVGLLLDRLGGRVLPPPGQRPADRLAYTLIEPWLEPYAFVLSDTLDALHAYGDRPFTEIAWRWSEGEAQPAWVELLRARRYVVETDGAGSVRILAPLAGELVARLPDDPARAARLAWERARPVLRHAVAAIRATEAVAGELRVDVHPYVHRPERTSFALGLRPHRVGADDAAFSSGPDDLAAWDRFLSSGLVLEGARLGLDGTVQLFGSTRDEAARPTGAPLVLADLAVAHRAVFHGGLAEPYMSLDRGYGPETSVVNYGGRLRDTRIGDVALRCDIRFKTFSLGLDVLTGEDVRARLRRAIPGFRTHLERFATDPAATGVLTQQTRLWFYPDDVDLTLSPEGDVLALRRVRMSAASERLAEGGITAAPGADPPWTRATIAAVNEDYDALAASFPELGALDDVVRMLALFTWLRQARSDGLAVADLDELLAVELPAWYTPRRFPRLLAFNALPPEATTGDVVTLDRWDAHAALARLRPSDGRVDEARSRLERAAARLDANDPAHRRLRDELERYDLGALSEVELDFLAYRAERLAMHRLVMDSLAPEMARPLAERARRGAAPRVFSVAIGGLDLGMGRALAGAARRSVTLAAPATDAEPLGSRRRPAARTRARASATTASSTAAPRVVPALPPAERVAVERLADPDGGTTLRVRADPAGPGARLRHVVRRPDGGAISVVRHESGTTFAFRVDRSGSQVRLRATPGSRPAGTAVPQPADASIPWLTVGAARPSAGDGTAREDRRLELRVAAGDADGAAVEVSRGVLQGFVLGLARGGRAVTPGDVLPPAAFDRERVLVRATAGERDLPWLAREAHAAPEAEAARLAGAIRRARATAGDGPAAAVAVRADAATRWASAPPARRRPQLWIPDEAFRGERAAVRAAVESAWGAHAVIVRDPDEARTTGLLVLVSDEAPDLLASRALRRASDPRLAGRLLAVVAAGVPVRADLAARLLEAGDLAGVGIDEVEPTRVHALADRLGAWAREMTSAPKGSAVADLVHGPLWYF